MNIYLRKILYIINIKHKCPLISALDVVLKQVEN